MVFSTCSHGVCAFFVPVCMLVRLEDAGIMGAGQETLHQHCALGVEGKTWASGAIKKPYSRKIRQNKAFV